MTAAGSPPFRIVLVHWLDSVSLESGAWMDAEDVEVNLDADAMRQESVGYLVGESKDAIALAAGRNASVDDPDHNGTKIGDVMTIPKCALLAPPIDLAPRRKRAVTTSPAQVTAGSRAVRQSSPRTAPRGRRQDGRRIMASRKNSTTKPAEAAAVETVNLREQLLIGLVEAGFKTAKAKDAPSKNYASILVDGSNVGYVFKQTKQGVRVLVALQPGDMPKAIKGFKASGRSGAFGAMGGFDEKNLSHAVEALKLSATRQGEAKAAKAEAAKAEKAAKAEAKKAATKRNGNGKAEPKPEAPEAPKAEEPAPAAA